MKKIVYLIAILFFCGCSDFLEEYSQDLVTAKTVDDFDEVLLGSGYIPSTTIERMSPNQYCAWLNLLDDDMNTTAGLASSGSAGNVIPVVRALYGYVTWQYEVGRNIQGNSVADDNFTWNNLYGRINVANIILAEIDRIAFHSDGDRLTALRIKGECHFLRAQCYLMLVNLYATAYVPENAAATLGVPLKLTGYVEHDKDKASQFDRAPVAEVYAQIVKDLTASADYLAQSPQKKPIYRASEEAATLLLSRVYLYMQDWENARTTAGKFLKMKNVLTEMAVWDEKDIFLTESSPEFIFSQGSLHLQNTLTAEVGDFCVARDLYALYDTTDYRQKAFFAISSKSDSVILKKYRTGTHRSHVSDAFALRTAEGYLNMAEACAMLDDPDANAWLNKLRTARIKDFEPQNYSGEELVHQVREERRKELCMEGHRWFDLRRYAVSTKFPYKKRIYRYYAMFADNWQYDYTTVAILEEDDLAYTFRIPAKVLEFDRTMPDNPREKRMIYTFSEPGEEGTEPGAEE